MSKFFIISGRVVPTLLVDEAGEPASFDTAQEAEACAQITPMCQALGWSIFEMDDGPVGEVTWI